jgi:hypothetical protein
MANRRHSAPTIDAALRAIERLELSTNRKPLRKFHFERARSFRAPGHLKSSHLGISLHITRLRSLFCSVTAIEA